MKEETSIKKVNIGYLLPYLLVPAAVLVAVIVFGIKFINSGISMLILILSALLFGFLWYYFGGKKLYNKRKTKMFEELEAAGFARNHTFHGDECVLAVDINRKNIALLFRWNPLRYYVLPADRITKAWVNDGRSGKGLLEGSSNVSFLFMIDRFKVQIRTFYSNQRYRMDSDEILTGISKADMMVEVIEAARRQG